MSDLTYKPCPNCKDGVVVDPLDQGEGTTCQVCSGLAVINEKCVCGRAAGMGEIWYVGKGRYYCGREVCLEITQKEIGAQEKNARPDYSDGRNWSLWRDRSKDPPWWDKFDNWTGCC